MCYFRIYIENPAQITQLRFQSKLQETRCRIFPVIVVPWAQFGGGHGGRVWVYGFSALVEQKIPHSQDTLHCFLHRHTLALKTSFPKLKEVFGISVETIDWIRGSCSGSSPLLSYFLKILEVIMQFCLSTQKCGALMGVGNGEQGGQGSPWMLAFLAKTKLQCWVRKIQHSVQRDQVT